MQTALSIRSCLKFGWETFKKRPLIYLAAAGLINVFWLLSEYGYYHELPGTVPWDALRIVLSALSMVLYVLILNNFILVAHDSVNTISYRDILRSSHFWKLVGTSLLSGLIILVGLILLIIPGLILMSMFAFAGYIAVDKGVRPIAALKHSRVITKGNRFRIFILAALTVSLTAFVDLIAYIFVDEWTSTIVGSVADLVLFPVTALALVHAYRVLEVREVVVQETGS